VIRVAEAALQELPGCVLVVATNCNGGVKEVLCFADVPDRWALWHHRCPEVADFAGQLHPILARARLRGVLEGAFGHVTTLGLASQLFGLYERMSSATFWTIHASIAATGGLLATALRGRLERWLRG
jgi:hypothetical protein